MMQQDKAVANLCRFCGYEVEATSTAAPIPQLTKEQAQHPAGEFQDKPCPSCQNLFDTGYLFFVGDCGHSGFIGRTSLELVVDREGRPAPEEQLFEMEKCFKCMGLHETDEPHH